MGGRDARVRCCLLLRRGGGWEPERARLGRDRWSMVRLLLGMTIATRLHMRAAETERDG